MAGKKKNSAAQMTREDLIREYLSVYRRCMEDDPKSFDAKGSLSALDQIAKMLGYDVPERTEDSGQVILRLAGEVGDRGD
ncbi:MAG: hypothetical protein E7425_00070 [Ruminococcaceae bacterium]|nr:hypothetical protein [Oscillospiraceae bacterium]